LIERLCRVCASVIADGDLAHRRRNNGLRATLCLRHPEVADVGDYNGGGKDDISGAAMTAPSPYGH